MGPLQLHPPPYSPGRISTLYIWYIKQANDIIIHFIIAIIVMAFIHSQLISDIIHSFSQKRSLPFTHTEY